MTKKKDIKDLLPVGRPTLYRPEFCEQLLEYADIDPYREIKRVNLKTGNEYIETIANDLPSLTGFAKKIGVAVHTIGNWGKAHPEFLDATTRAKTMAEHILNINALAGRYNPRYAIFVAKNYTDMRDVKDLNLHKDPEPPLTTKELLARRKELDEELAVLMPQLNSDT